MFVKPKEGLQIWDPFRKDRLPAEGREVPDGDMYWQTILRDEDIVVSQPPKQVDAKAEGVSK